MLHLLSLSVKTAAEPSSPLYSTNVKSASLKLCFRCQVKENQSLLSYLLISFHWLVKPQT